MAMYKIKTTNIENFTGIDAGGSGVCEWRGED